MSELIGYQKVFRAYKLEKSRDGYIVTLFLNYNDTEFSEEYFYSNKEVKKSDKEININIVRFIKENFKGMKISAIKIVAGSLLVATIVFGGVVGVAQAAESTVPDTYTVQSGDSLWKISSRYGVSIDQIKDLNGLTSNYLYVGQKLKLTDKTNNTITKTEYEYYTVQSGDSLWKISQKFGVTISYIKDLNNMTGDALFPGQSIRVNEIKTEGLIYVVKSGDTLWKIANNNNSTIDAIKDANDLTTDYLDVGQELFIPIKGNEGQGNEEPKPVYNWPDVTYIVQGGDTVSAVAMKFNTSVANILAFNYMEPDEWLNAGDKIAISDYAPRTYTVNPGEATAPSSVGKIVDWFTEGQYVLKRGDEFTLVDVYTGKQFKAKMMAGYNHSDIEPLTAADTDVMKSLFGTWEWNPRPVVIFINGMNIAGSLSGMPHGVDLLSGNGITGHFDLYLKNSTSHSASASPSYIQMHQDMVEVSAGLK